MSNKQGSNFMIVFTGQESFARGDRSAIVRHKDNLKVEGEMKAGRSETTSAQATAHMTMKQKRTMKMANGERSKAVRHEDNLKVGSGEFAKREQRHAAVKGERAEVQKKLKSWDSCRYSVQI